MRKVLGALVVLVTWFGLSACTPTPTVTANPSTIRPACEQVTTVTGTLTPKDGNREVSLERQDINTGKWSVWVYFPNKEAGRIALQAPINKTTGNYSLTYYAPGNGQYATTRLRIKTTVNRAEVVSKSWYVTKPTGC